jgi:hypothetical protein
VYISSVERRNIEIEKLKIEKLKIKLKKIESLKIQIIKSNIDFSKFGWVSKVSEILKIKPQKVGNWMKRNMLEFYDDNCFKRNNKI